MPFFGCPDLPQLQCGVYRIFGGSTANCSFEVIGCLVYLWMAFLSLKLIWYYDDLNGDRYRQLKASFFKSFLALLSNLQSAKKTIHMLHETMREVQDSAYRSQVQPAVNMLRVCKKRDFTGCSGLEDAVVTFLSSLYPQSEETRRRLRRELPNIGEANLSKNLSEDIIKQWQVFHDAKRSSLEACQKGRGLRIESAHTLEEVKTLGSHGEVKSMQLYVQKENSLEEIELDFDVANEEVRREALLRKWTERMEKSRRLNPDSTHRQSFHALISDSKPVEGDFSLLPMCGLHRLRCCLPSICYHIPRCLQRCTYRRDQLPLLECPQYDDRRCSLGLCFVNLVSPLQEQLLTTLCFASASFLFNLATVVVGSLDGCQTDILPCGVLLFQRSLSVFCTLVFMASTVYCLKRNNFKCLEPLVTLFEMTSALEKLARQAEDFQEVLGSTDEICQKIRATEKAKEAPLKFPHKFL